MSSSRICQALHDEHRATIEFTERLEKLLASSRRAPPDVNDDFTQRLLRDIPAAVGPTLLRHFDFEESRLFTILAETGDAAIGAHLTDEHDVMREQGRELAALAREAAAAGFDAARWQAFRRVAADLGARLLGHVQKEEMVLLPLLEETLAPESDAELHLAYTASH